MFRFYNLGLVLGMALKFYSSVGKRLKLKVRQVGGPIITFGEVKGKNSIFVVPL